MFRDSGIISWIGVKGFEIPEQNRKPVKEILYRGQTTDKAIPAKFSGKIMILEFLGVVSWAAAEHVRLGWRVYQR